MHRQHESSREDVLALVCSRTTNVSTVCRSICTSSAAAAAITCKGCRHLSLHIRWEGRLANNWNWGKAKVLADQCSWIAKYGASLVGGVTLELAEDTEPHDDEGVERLLESLVAVALRPPVSLSSLRLISIGEKLIQPERILHHLDSQALTSLNIQSLGWTLRTAVDAALPGFTNLRELRLRSSRISAATLFALPQLEVLALRDISSKNFSAALPSLTRLTNLSYSEGLPWEVISSGLPPSLLHLDVDIRGLHRAAEELVTHLSSLTKLRHLGLKSSISHAAAWPQLKPLRELILSFCSSMPVEEQPAVAAGIAGATALTRLYVRCRTTEDTLDWAATLRSLTHLKDFTLHLPYVTAPFAAFGGPTDSVLQQLTALELKCQQAHLLALTQVYGLTGLRRLGISCSSMGKEGVDVIAHNMQHLTSLSIGNLKAEEQVADEYGAVDWRSSPLDAPKALMDALQRPGQLASLQQLRFELPRESWGADDDQELSLSLLSTARDMVRAVRPRVWVEGVYSLSLCEAVFSALSH